MELLKCLLVDDEHDAIENLQRVLERHCTEIHISASARNGKDALKILNTHKADILFLDIQMNNETGFDLPEMLTDFSGSLIFVTAFDEFGLKAIKFSATDYLLKPVDPAELQRAVEKSRKKKALESIQQQIAMLLQSVTNQSTQQQKKIALADADEIRYATIDEIVYCRSDNSYTTFFMRDGQKLMVSKPLEDYESLLSPYGFVRTHQSYLVNKYRIRSYKKVDGGYLVMEDKSEVPLSRQRKSILKELF